MCRLVHCEKVKGGYRGQEKILIFKLCSFHSSYNYCIGLVMTNTLCFLPFQIAVLCCAGVIGRMHGHGPDMFLVAFQEVESEFAASITKSKKGLIQVKPGHSKQQKTIRETNQRKSAQKCIRNIQHDFAKSWDKIKGFNKKYASKEPVRQS